MEKIRMVSMDAFGLLLLLISCVIVQVVSGSRCPPFVPCGDIGSVSFPFTTAANPECGVLVINGCEEDPGARKSIQNNNRWFDIANISLIQSTITIRDEDLLDLLSSRSCEVLGYNSTSFMVNSPLASSKVMYSASLLRCNHALDPTPSPDILSNSMVCENVTYYYGIIADYIGDLASLDAVLNSSNHNHLRGCSIIQLPLGGPAVTKDPNRLLNSLTSDIPIQISLYPGCSRCNVFDGGQCRIDSYGKLYCDKGTARKIVVIAVASSAGAVGVLIVLAWCFRRRFHNKENPTYQIIEAFLKDHGHLAAKRYSYLEVKKATSSFKDKLGQGGYGSVYKGKLPDGTLVAVKVLSESKGNGEEFMNEVASISVTSHVNIVQLLGFTLEGSKRALI